MLQLVVSCEQRATFSYMASMYETFTADCNC